MANPRQRRKKRSSSYKPVSMLNAKRRQKKTPVIRGPKALQDAWDNAKTVTQNYASLGLVHNLNPIASGGAEIIAEPLPSSAPTSSSTSTAADTADTSQAIPKGHGRIIRDEDGNVISIQLADDDEPSPSGDGSVDDDEAMQDAQVSPDLLGKWATTLAAPTGGPQSTTGVVEVLESISVMRNSNLTGPTISASMTGVGSRHASEGETTYLARLVEKYGVGDVAAMARDRKLNPEQRTEGQLRRALQRGGFS